MRDAPRPRPHPPVRLVLGRDARDGVRPDATGRPREPRPLLLAGEHPPVGGRDRPPPPRAPRGDAGRPRRARGKRHARLPRVRGSLDGVLQAPRLPGRPVPRLRAPHLQRPRRAPRRLHDDAGAERVRDHGHAQDLGHHRPPRRDRGPDADHCRRPRRVHACSGAATERGHQRLRARHLRDTPRTCSSSRSPSATASSSPGSSTASSRDRLPARGARVPDAARPDRRTRRSSASRRSAASWGRPCWPSSST